MGTEGSAGMLSGLRGRVRAVCMYARAHMQVPETKAQRIVLLDEVYGQFAVLGCCFGSE